MQHNIVWNEAKVSCENRNRLNAHASLCIWFTGYSGSGKSTLANAMEIALHRRGIHTYLLDGDNVRHGLNRDLGFSAHDRTENVRRVAEVANLFLDAGIVVITALISPFADDRQMARDIMADRFIEVFVDCPLDLCMERDPKGLYKKAKSGLIQDFTGVQSPYEAPVAPDIIVNTSISTVDACVASIVRYLEESVHILGGTRDNRVQTLGEHRA